MAAWVEDRWFRTVTRADGTTSPEKSSRHGYGRRWRVRYETTDGLERSKSFARKPDAENFRTQVGADLLRGTYLDPDAGKISLRKWAEQWLDNQTFDEATRESARNRLAHILAGLGDKRLDQLASSPSAIQSWLKGLPLADSTKRGCRSLLSTIFAAAIEDGRMARNPAQSRSVKVGSEDRRKAVPLERDQVDAVRAALPARFRAMMDVGTLVGVRQGEMFALAKEDIDFLRRVVHVHRQVKVVGGKLVFALPKHGRTRDVPVNGRGTEAISEHIRLFPPVRVTLPAHAPGTRRHGKPETRELLFTSPMARNALRRQKFNDMVWKPALRAAGIPDTRENGMHVLRHTYASVLLANGVDVRRLAECLGHGDPAFTMRVYTHLMKGGDEAVRRALDSAAGGPGPALSRADSL